MIRRIGNAALALALGIAVLSAPVRAPAADGPVPAQKVASVAPAKAVVNVNTATAKELTKLDGIGEKIAKAVVEFRDKNGPFKAPEDLLKVKGIGPKKLTAIKSQLTVK